GRSPQRQGSDRQRHQDLQQRRQGGAVLSPEAGCRRQEQLGEGADRRRLLQAFAVRLRRTAAPAMAGAATCLCATAARLTDNGRDDAMTAILEMRGVSKSFSGVQALRDVNFTVEAGQIHALVGENGAGKSTLMKVLSGVYPHGDYEGSIFFDGEERRFRDVNDSEALGIIIIHQELALIPLMSIAENIFLSHPPSRLGVIDRDTVY